MNPQLTNVRHINIFVVINLKVEKFCYLSHYRVLKRIITLLVDSYDQLLLFPIIFQRLRLFALFINIRRCTLAIVRKR